MCEASISRTTICTVCAWTGPRDELKFVRVGEDDWLEQCPLCESVESLVEVLNTDMVDPDLEEGV